MPENHRHPVFIEYEKRKNNKQLSPNLDHPTPASLRDECLIVYKEKGCPTDNITIRSFFGVIDGNENYVNTIANTDIDRFRPLGYYLKKTIRSTNRLNVDLLSWLMFKDSEEPQPEPPQHKKCWNIKMYLIIFFMFIISKVLLYIWEINASSIKQPLNNEKCMYWTGYHYAPIKCDEIKDGVIVIPLDRIKLERMRMVPFFVKVTKSDIGKLWWGRIEGQPAYFTDSGINPIDTNKRLLPLTNYMVMRHETKKNIIIDIIEWSYYIIIVVLGGLILFRFMRRKGF